jgi:hypothetical protein
MNVTCPVGTLPPFDVTVAVTVTVCPLFAGLGEVEREVVVA